MLSVNNIIVRYPDGHLALNQVSFEINEGETIGIIGSNGAGKSTLLKTMVGILLPDGGNIDINGLSVTKTNLRKLRNLIGVVFQNPQDQLFMSEVYEDIAFGLRNMGMSETEVESRVKKTVEALGIEKLLHQNSSRLSGGEQRMAAIATIMAMEPKLVLFDEPTSSLDPKTRRNLILRLKEYQVTKLIATHDLDMALELCDRVIILKEGQIYKQGNARELLSDKEIMEAAELELPFCLQSI